MGMGRAWKGSHALTHPTFHVPGEPGAKPLVEDLLLGRGFVGNRAAPLLRPTAKRPGTQAFLARAGIQASVPHIFTLRLHRSLGLVLGPTQGAPLVVPPGLGVPCLPLLSDLGPRGPLALFLQRKEKKRKERERKEEGGEKSKKQ